MTKEEAIKQLKYNRVLCINSETEPFAIAYDMAIEALEQQPVLDKIKSEIEQIEYLNIEDGSDGYDKYIEQYEVLKIIDKYKTESEE